MTFSGKTAVVSGGTSGIGAAIVRALAAEGATVVFTDVASAPGTALVGEVAKAGGRAVFVPADLREPAAAAAVVAKATEATGRLDVLVNNAAVLYRSGTQDCTDEQWLNTVAVNLNAVFFLSRAAAKAMTAGGAIVNVASEFGIYAVPQATAYCTTKGAVISLTKAMALDLAPANIRVNAIAPGKVRTAMLESSIRQRGLDLAEGLGRIEDIVPMHRIGTPEEIAKVVLFLASERAAYITGTTLAADGGNTASGPGGIVPRIAKAS